VKSLCAFVVVVIVAALPVIAALIFAGPGLQPAARQASKAAQRITEKITAPRNGKARKRNSKRNSKMPDLIDGLSPVNDSFAFSVASLTDGDADSIPVAFASEDYVIYDLTTPRTLGSAAANFTSTDSEAFLEVRGKESLPYVDGEFPDGTLLCVIPTNALGLQNVLITETAGFRYIRFQMRGGSPPISLSELDAIIPEATPHTPGRMIGGVARYYKPQLAN
jgi:hypothetical protein